MGGSALIHVALLAAIVFIPPVRDALSLAAMFSDAAFVDRPYSQTEIGGDVDIVELTTERFRYPDGYFLMDQPGFPANLPPSPAVAPTFPQPNPVTPPGPTPLPSPLPSPSPPASASPAVVIATNQPTPIDPKPTPNEKDIEKAQKELEKTSKETGIELASEGEINKRPFKDFVIYANDLKNQGKLDIEQPFEVVIDAELDKDGKLTKSDFTKRAGDFNLTDLGGRLVAAMNDSGILFYLKKLNEDNPGTKVVFTIKQTSDQVIATVESEAASPASARALSKGFNLMLATGAKTREGKEEEVYLRNTTVSANEKKILFSLTLPRQTVIDLLKNDIASAPSSGSPSP